MPNPLLPENRRDTSEAVIRQQAALGIAWDGDFDRCFFFDEKGRFIESAYVVGLQLPIFKFFIGYFAVIVFLSHFVPFN